jgi:poly(A) polymerase/tRNA nucleotidyltransferase (CCA-adding enzyme)
MEQHPIVLTIAIPVPESVQQVLKTIQDAGFEAYIVGGPVRDSFMNRTPADWDIVTSAYPEEVIQICETISQKCVYENTYGTVSWIYEDKELNDPEREIQITTYRTESGYSDHRRPDAVEFTRNLQDDISRRDFTINGLVYDPIRQQLIDYTDGIKDIFSKTIQCIGNPRERFHEDALRMMRAVRFSAQLGFTISHETILAIQEEKELLSKVSQERIRDEFIKIIDSPRPQDAIMVSHETGLLEYIIPELLEGAGCDQSRSHIYDVFTHNVYACQNAANQDWSFHVKLAALFHDIGKPRTRRWDADKKLYTFYGHEVVGARMTETIMKRMRFSKEITEKVVKLVRYHMFFSDTEAITLSAVRRMIQNVGKELIWDLMQVRRSDRIGMGKKDAEPYRLRKYEAMIEEVLRDPLSVGMLALNGNDLMNEFGIAPGPRIGWILHALLDQVLEDPKRNNKKDLSETVKHLMTLKDIELCLLGKQGKEEMVSRETQIVGELRKKHRVN